MKGNPIVINILLALIKSLVIAYDVITYPLYFLVQKPNKRLRAANRKKAQQLDPTSPYSPWARIKHRNHIENHFIDECKTVSQLFSTAVQVFAESHCLGVRQVFGEEEEQQLYGKPVRKLILDDHYQWFTYRQIDAKVNDLAQGLLSSGVRPKHNVALFAETRMEWMVTCQAVLRIGATVVTLYPTLGMEDIIHCISETEATHVVTTSELLAKLAPIADRVPHMTCVIYINGLKEPNIRQLFTEQQLNRIKILSLTKTEELGRGAKAQPISESQETDDTAILMYTSGSTGVPKAVMITHKNILNSIKGLFCLVLDQKDLYCAYLPLAHIFELTIEMYSLSIGMPIGYATPLTLTDGSLAVKRGTRGDTCLLRPTFMVAVPLILDRIRKSISENVELKGLLFKNIFRFAIAYKKYWKVKGFDTPVVNSLICRKLSAILGGRVRFMASGGAPLASETHEFITICLNLPVIQGYGLTETTGPCTVMGVTDLYFGRIGPALGTVQIKLVDWLEGQYRATDKPHPRGEIVVGGDTTTAGYYKNQELTKESYKREQGVNWFYTGDIGQIYEDGSVQIVDRKKDILKLQSGEYVSLGKIEAILMSCTYLDNICVYGDSFQTYLIALVVPNAKALRALANRLSKPEAMDYKQMCNDLDLTNEINKNIQELGQNSGLNKSEIPVKIKLCSDEWLPDTGLVTAALKLRRKQINLFYQNSINVMYEQNINNNN